MTIDHKAAKEFAEGTPIAEANRRSVASAVNLALCYLDLERQLEAERDAREEAEPDANRYQALLPVIIGFQWLAEGRGGRAYDETEAYEADVRYFVNALLDCLPPHRDQPFHAVVIERNNLKQRAGAAERRCSEIEAATVERCAFHVESEIDDDPMKTLDEIATSIRALAPKAAAQEQLVKSPVDSLKASTKQGTPRGVAVRDVPVSAAPTQEKQP